MKKTLEPKPEPATPAPRFRQKFLALLQEKNHMKERRERIATQVLCGIIADPSEDPEPELAAQLALSYADALIEALEEDMCR
jgi:hypothetical protein